MSGFSCPAPRQQGAMTLRRAGRLHHLKVGAAHARRHVLAIVDEQEATVVALDTGEILSTHRIEPEKGLLAQHTTRPRPMAGVSSDPMITCVADVATHVSPMSRLMTLARPEGFEPPTY